LLPAYEPDAINPMLRISEKINFFILIGLN